MALPAVRVTVQVGTERFFLDVAPGVAKFLLEGNTRAGLAPDATDLQRATALAGLLVGKVVDDVDNPGSHFGDFKRKIIGEKEGLKRDLTPDEWHDRGRVAVRAAYEAAL